MEKNKQNREFLILFAFTVALMIFHLFIGEIMILNSGILPLFGWFASMFLRQIFKNFKYKTVISLIIFFTFLFVAYKGYISIPVYILLFIMMFILLLHEAIRRKSTYMKVQILAILVLFLCFFSFNYYLSSTRLIKSLNLAKIIEKNNFFINDITEESLEEVSSLSINDTQFDIPDLRGMEHLKNLYKLSIEDNGVIKDYTPIQELKKLTMFFTWKADLDKLESLNEIPSVEILQIAFPKKGYLDSLKSFPNLKSLTVHGSELWDITTLQGAKNLKSLNIADCKVKNFQGIEYFEALEELHLYELNIEDSSSLLTLKNLKSVSLHNCTVQDLNALKKKGEELGIVFSEMKDIHIP